MSFHYKFVLSNKKWHFILDRGSNFCIIVSPNNVITATRHWKRMFYRSLFSVSASRKVLWLCRGVILPHCAATASPNLFLPFRIAPLEAAKGGTVSEWPVKRRKGIVSVALKNVCTWWEYETVCDGSNDRSTLNKMCPCLRAASPHLQRIPRARSFVTKPALSPSHGGYGRICTGLLQAIDWRLQHGASGVRLPTFASTRV